MADTTVPEEYREFRSGFPAYTLGGPAGYIIFEVLLADGSIVQAYVKGGTGENDWVERWYVASEDFVTHGTPLDYYQVEGWRDTMRCADIAAVLARYVEKPYSLAARGEWINAQNRHVRASKDAHGNPRVTCLSCARLFVSAWQQRYRDVPEGWERFT